MKTSLFCIYNKNTSLCILFLIFQFNRFDCFLFRIKIDKTVDSFLVIDIISKEHVSRLMKDKNPKFPSKYSSRKSLQVSSYMLHLFSDKYTIHTNKKKDLLLKTNNKRNSKMGNSVKKLRILQSGLVSLQY